jgi:osmoprotectant transport system substrate-binding protein
MQSAMRHALALLALAIAVALGGCGGSDEDPTQTSDRPAPAAKAPIRIGTKNFTEQTILGELYRQALEAKGFDVVLKAKVGSTEIIHRVLRRGDLDMYPEYVGVLLSEVAERRWRPPSAKAAYAAAKRYEKKNGFTMLAQTPLEDSNALAVKPAFAKRHGLRTIADLRRLKGPVKIAALAEFRTRFEGLEGLREVYGLRNLRLRTREGLDRYAALDSGAVDVASVFTTEGHLATKRYQLLADPRRLFASGHVAPIVSDKTLKVHGTRLQTAIDAVSKVLRTPAMRDMNAAVDLHHRTAAAVAAEFLRANSLL